MEQLSDRDRVKRDVNRGRYKTIEYSCGCIYQFDHEIILKHICPEHETHLITYHGWNAVIHLTCKVFGKWTSPLLVYRGKRQTELRLTFVNSDCGDTIKQCNQEILSIITNIK